MVFGVANFLDGFFGGESKAAQPKFFIYKQHGIEAAWVMAFPLVSLLYRGVEYERSSFNPFFFSEKIIFVFC